MTELNQPSTRSILHLVVISWIALLVLNGAALILVYSALKNNQKTESSNLVAVQKPNEKPEPMISCTAGCRDFDAIIATLAAQQNSNPVETPYMASLPKAKREIFIPLGSVTAKSFDWLDTGLQTYIDSADFGSKASVYLEASIHIPTANGRAFLRLMQDNEHIYIPGTEISAEGDKPVLITSKSFNLWQGNKLYKVQLKTSMDYEAVIDFARLRIVY